MVARDIARVLLSLLGQAGARFSRPELPLPGSRPLPVVRSVLMSDAPEDQDFEFGDEPDEANEPDEGNDQTEADDAADESR